VRFLPFVAAVVLTLARSASAAPSVQVLFGPVNAPIAAFAQDGSLLAMFVPGSGSCNVVRVVALDGVKAALPKPRTSNVTCRWDMAGPAPQLAVAAGSAAALWTLHEQATTEFDDVVGATVRDPVERRFSEIAHSKAGAGLWLGGVAADGTTLVYSVAGVDYVDQLGCLEGGSCAQKVGGGGIHRVVGRRNPLVPGTGPALQVATAAGRVAYVPAATVGGGGRPLPGRGGPIRILTATTGALVSSPHVPGIPVALALSAHVLAVLTHVGVGQRVVWFDPQTGRRLGYVGVSPDAAPELGVSDQVAVYRVGLTIKQIDLGSGTITKVVKAEADPIGLSLEGTRLAWAENVNGHGSVRAVFLRGRG